MRDAKAGWRLFPVDPARVARSHGLVVEPQVDGTYVVRSHYWVQLDDVTVPVCDCGDASWRTGLCKHALAAMSYEETRGVSRETPAVA